MRKITIAAAGAALVWTFNPISTQEALAQDRSRADTRIERTPGGFSVVFGGMNRAVLGVTLAQAGRSDTLGVRIDEVNPEGPAAKAGIKSGMIITSIDGISLRISGDDAADNELLGLGQRRLTRALQKASPGDEVELRVLDSGQSRTIRVKTVAASELASEPVRTAMGKIGGMSNRAVVGMSIGVTGSIRDTAGLFVNSVTTGGPAEKAGIVEGDRISEINGVDLRVPQADIEDMPARMARVTRFNRELQKATAGDRVTFRVVTGGRTREVAVTTVKASELPNRGFQVHIGDGQFFMGSPEGGNNLQFFNRGDGPIAAPFRFELGGPDGEKLNKAMEELRMNLRDLPFRIRTEVDAARPRVWTVPGRSVAPARKTSPVVRRWTSI
jgi:S1-C subfamily serine protease